MKELEKQLRDLKEENEILKKQFARQKKAKAKFVAKIKRIHVQSKGI